MRVAEVQDRRQKLQASINQILLHHVPLVLPVSPQQSVLQQLIILLRQHTGFGKIQSRHNLRLWIQLMLMRPPRIR